MSGSENTALFERLMEIHSNSPKNYTMALSASKSENRQVARMGPDSPYSFPP